MAFLDISLVNFILKLRMAKRMEKTFVSELTHSQISLVVLPTVCHTIVMILVGRILHWINL